MARIIFDEMHQLTGILNSEGTVIECNRTALERGGVTARDIIGKPFWETFWWTITPETQEQLRNAIALAAQGKFVRYDVEVYANSGRREVMVVDFSLTPVKDDEGNVVFLVPEARDITEKKAYEREIAQKDVEIRSLLTQIDQLDEIKEQLFSDVSRQLQKQRVPEDRKDEVLATLADELRSPLVPVRDLSGGMDAELKWAQIVMERQIQHMGRLLDGLLDVSRLASGKARLWMERLSVRESLVSAIESVRPMIQARAHKLTVEIPPESIYIEADPGRFAQIFTQLLTNAAKYTDPGGRICVCARLVEGSVVIGIRDNGSGISEDQLPHVFEMFSQTASVFERPEGGLGIGLSLVRNLVLLHGGAIEARSGGPGQGSEFVVTLPLAIPESPPPD